MRGEECGERHRGGEFASSHWHDIHGVAWSAELPFGTRRSFLKRLELSIASLISLTIRLTMMGSMHWYLR